MKRSKKAIEQYHQYLKENGIHKRNYTPLPPLKKKFKRVEQNTLDKFINEKPAPTRLDKIIKVQSKGERRIANWLTKNRIRFIPEKEFWDLINPSTGARLRMDFYLTDLRICIEFDGRQHFKESKQFDKNGRDCLEWRMARDNVKNNYCQRKGIKMVRIKYNELYQLEDILKESINTLNNP